MSGREGDGPNLIACLTCRSKHLKCDAQLPVCGRCAKSSLPCTYVRSRRGFQGRRRRRLSPDTPTEMPPALNDTEVGDGLDLNPVSTSIGLPAPEYQHSQTEELSTLSQTRIDTIDYNGLIDVYYREIHPAHPFVLPRKLYLQDQNALPNHLKVVMAFMASHLIPDNFDGLQEEALSALFNSSVPDDGFKVQALLLLTLTSYARFERDRGNKALNQASNLAVQLGFNAEALGAGQSLIHQESWRRTYWELYTVTGMVSLIAGMNFRIRRPDELLLPGSCQEYEKGRVSELRPLQTMRNRVSMEDYFQWSSFAYKIEAMRILNSIFEYENPDGIMADTTVHAIGASIKGFLLSLPEEKRSPLRDNGDVDEVMSCALMIINLAGICLHFPRSTLARGVGFRTVCGNGRRDGLESDDERFHRAAAVRYANGLSKLISSRDSLRSLTPCFSCSVAYAAATHLAASLLDCNSGAQHEEHIQLELSALNIIGTIWPIGRVVKSQLAQYSREVLAHCSVQNAMASGSATMLNPSAISAAPNEPWLDELANQSVDIASGNMLFNFMGSPPETLNTVI